MKFIDIFQSNVSGATILSVITQISFYVIGLIINTKIVCCCWKNKEHNKAWQLHIIYSVTCTILFSFDIPFALFSTCVPHLSILTGEWICYLALFINSFCLVIIGMSSLMVAITKYIFVVHWNKALAHGHEKVQCTLSTIFLLIASYIAIVSTALKTYIDYGIIHTCFGTDMDIFKVNNGFHKMTLHNMTPQVMTQYDLLWRILETDATYEEWGYAYVVLSRCLRVLKGVFYGIGFCNLPEAFFYYKIFKRMIRSDFKIPYLLLKIRLTFYISYLISSY